MTIRHTASMLMGSALVALGLQAQAASATYNVTTIWFEPQTQPRNTLFMGSFDYDSSTKTVSNLKGQLSESMTDTNGLPIDADHMVWLNLTHPLVSWYDATLGGTFAATFKNGNTLTFSNREAGATDFWSPEVGVANEGVYYGNPVKASNPGNAYALIFVPDNPLAALTSAQLSKLAYADCTPTAPGGMRQGGGMMGSTCMTGWSLAGHGAEGTMGGEPFSQSITLAAAVPEPSTVTLSLLGMAMAAGALRRHRKA